MIVYCLCGVVCILLDGRVYNWELAILPIMEDQALVIHRCEYDDMH